MKEPTLSLHDIAHEARVFRDTFQTLHLATSNAAGAAVASYAPFALSERGGFFVYVSELAAHTANLCRGGPVSVLFIEAEADANHVFARRRLTVECTVDTVPRGSAGFSAALGALRARFGEFVDFLATLQDFHAFELVPTHAAYVRGFAQAYDLPGADFAAMRPIGDRGHRAQA